MTEKRVIGRPFQPGASGNPGGRPADTDEIRAGKEMLRRAMPDAVQAVVDVLHDPEAKVAERLTAAKIILDRVMGKATQPIVADVSHEEDPMTLDEMMQYVRELYEEIWGDKAK